MGDGKPSDVHGDRKGLTSSEGTGGRGTLEGKGNERDQIPCTAEIFSSAVYYTYSTTGEELASFPGLTVVYPDHVV